VQIRKTGCASHQVPPWRRAGEAPRLRPSYCSRRKGAHWFLSVCSCFLSPRQSGRF
jgi:hypothetical protein